IVIRSGVTFECSMANILPVRAKPVWTSSTMSRMPWASQRARSARRSSGGATVKPPSPWTGSMTVAGARVGLRWGVDARSSGRRAGTGETGLDFVDDEQDAMGVAALAQRAQEFGRSDVEAAFALDRLDDDGRHPVRADVGLEQQVQRPQGVLHGDAVQPAGEGDVVDLGRQRAEILLVGGDLAGQGHAHEGAAVERAGKGHDPGAAGGGARDLDGVF